MLNNFTQRYWFVLFLLIFFGAFFFRIAGLTQVGVWADELALTDDVFRQGDVGFTLRQVANKGDHVPFFHLLYHVVPFAPYNNVISLRMMPLLSSLLAIALFVHLLKQSRFKPVFIALGASLFAFHPIFIEFSRESRAYPFLMMLVFIITAFFFELLKGNRTTKIWLGFTITSMLAYFTHFTALMILGAQIIAILMAWLIAKKISGVFVARWWLACGIATAPMVIWSIFFARNNPGVGAWIPPITTESIQITLNQLLAGSPHPLVPFIAQALIILALAFTTITLWRYRQQTSGIHAIYWLTLALSPIIFVMLVSYFLRSMWVTRYLLLTVPAIIMIFLLSMRQLSPHLSLPLMLILTLIYITTSLQTLNTTRFERPESYFETPLFTIDEAFQPGDAIYIDTWGNYLYLYGHRITNITHDSYLLRWQWQAPLHETVHNLDDLGYNRVWLAFIPEVMNLNTNNPYLTYIDSYRDIQIWLYDVPDND